MSHCIRVQRIHWKQVRTSNPPFPSRANYRCASGRARSSIGRVAVACTTQAHTQPEQALHLFLIHQAPMVVKCGGLWSVTFAGRRIGTISREEGPPPAPRVQDLGGLLLELFAGGYLGTFRSFITRNFGTHIGYQCILVFPARLRARLDERQPMPVPTSPWDKEDFIVCTRLLGTFSAMVAGTHRVTSSGSCLLCLILTTIWYHQEE